ncbi:MAG: hypothetical protein ACOYEV_07455 [Candidatus Nanopelagicales bacterium]
MGWFAGRDHGAGPGARRGGPGRQLIGQVITDAVRGAGHPTIAANRGLPESTVWRWLRRRRANAERLRFRGTTAEFALHPSQPPLLPQGRPLADAVEALAPAAPPRSAGLGCCPGRGR